MKTPIRRALLMVISTISVSCSEYEVKSQIDPALPGDTSEIFDDAPAIDVVPSALDLGIVCDTETGAVRISSIGNTPLTLTDISAGGSGWQLIAVPSLPRILAPGESIPLELESGNGPGSLLIESNDPDAPLTTVQLTAENDTPPLLSIISHIDGDILEPSSSTLFMAEIFDEDDAATDLVVDWSSNIDGYISSSIPAADGSVQLDWNSTDQSSGNHELSAVVIDSCEAQASDTVSICQNEGYISDGLDLSTWNFEGSATWDSTNEYVQLTNTNQNQAGTAFQTSSTVSADNVEIEFSFFVSGGSGADGISMTALDSMRMTGFVGDSGGGIGYAGLPGWSIEVDTWYNAENNDLTQDDHLSVHINGDTRNYVASAALPEMEDGNWHDMSVIVNGTWMTVSIDGAIYIDQDVSGLTAFPAYIGFTGATGSATNFHLIDSLTVEAFVCDDE